MREINERSKDGSETLLSVTEKEGVVRREEVIDEGDHLSRAESLEGYKICDAGDLVVNIMLAWKRGLGVATEPGIVSPAYAVFRPDPEKVESGYLDYMIRANDVIRLIKTFSYGVVDSRLRIYPDRLLALPFPRPPTCEQKAIARFLDRRTSRIDDLIAKKGRLIELLEEQRTALISQAVTKGLDPDMPMKDSGVQWLGEIPEHWGVPRMKYVSELHRGFDLPERERKEGEFPVISSGGVIDNHTAPKIEGPGVITGRYGSVGSVFFTTDDFWPLNTALYVRDFRENHPRFVYYLLQVLPVLAHAAKSAVPGIDRKDIHEERAPLPPVEEQRRIARLLRDQEKRLALVSSKIEGVISRLREYRTALITAAVTGKIDVRDYAA